MKRVMVVGEIAYLVEHLKNKIQKMKDVKSVATVLEEDIKISLLENSSVDVIFILSTGTSIDLIKVCRKVLNYSPSVKIVVWRLAKSKLLKAHIEILLELGINSILTRESVELEIIKSIEASIQNVPYFSNEIAKILQEKIFFKKKSDDTSVTQKLSTRELEVLNYIIQGSKNREIAETLNLSVRTIEMYRERVKKKLKVKTSAELARIAIEQGLFEPNVA